MKRKSLLILLLLAAFAPWRAVGQETWTLYETETANSSNIPVYGNWADAGDCTAEFIIPASEITILDGNTISKMTFYLSSQASKAWNAPYEVYLSETTATTMTGLIGNTNATKVFSGTLNGNAATMEVPFNVAEYEYNGGNLLVGFYETDEATYADARFYGKSVSNAAYYGYTGYSGYGSYGASFIPRTTFTYELAAGDCDKPETMVADPVTSETATLTWSGGSGTYNVEIKGGSYADWTSVLSNTTQLTTVVEGLTPNTAYQVRVQSVCTGETPTSGYKTASFTTPLCDNMCAINYTLTDSGYDGWDNSAHFNVVDVATNEVIAVVRLATGGSGSGSFQACHGQNISFVWVAGGTYDYECGYTFTDYAGEEIFSGSGAMSAPRNHTVACFPDDCPNPGKPTESEVTAHTAKISWEGNGLTEFNLEYIYAGHNEWFSKPNVTSPCTIDGLPASTEIQVRVQGTCDAERDEWSETLFFMTDVACPAPTGLAIAAGYPTAHGVSFTWDYNDGEVFQYAMPNDLITDPAEVPWAGNIWHAGPDFPYWNNLDAETEYSFWLRKDCGDEGYSEPVSVTFTTTVVCPAPTGIAMQPNSLTAHKVGFTWDYTEGEAFQFDVLPGTLTDFSTLDWSESAQTNNQYWFTLEANTEYTFVIRKDCGDEGFSEPAYHHFTTATGKDTPTNFALTPNSETSYGAKVTWQGVATNDLHQYYELYVNTTSTISDPIDEAKLITGITAEEYTFDNLNSSTTYYVFVRDVCGSDGTSDWSYFVSFTTLCGAVTVDADNDFFESFDTNFPDCWSNPVEYINDQDRKWNRSTAQNHTTTSGSGSAYSNGFYGPIYLIMPDLDIADYKTDVKLTFWSYNTWTSSYGKNSVVLLNGSEETELWSPTSVSQSWVDATVNLSEYKGQTIRLAFKYEGNYAHGWYVDDVKVAFDPTCMPVGTLAEATEVKSTSAKLSWTLTDDTQTQWHVGYSTTQGGPYQIAVANTNDGFLLEDLTPETPYFVIVRADCGAEDGQGEWSNEITFTTLEDCFTPYDIVADNITPTSADLTWTGESDEYNIEYWEKAEPVVVLFEGFENADDYANWQAFGNVTTNTGTRFGRLTTSPRTDTYHFSFSSYSSATDYNQYLISPEVNAGGGDLEFYYRMSSSSSAGENFEVGYSTTGNAVSDFTWFEPSVTCTSVSYQKYSKENLPAGTKYIAIHYFQTTDRYQLFIDDIKITTPAVPSEVHTATSTTHSVALEGLEAGKTYEVKVQGLCGSVEGEWSNVYEFTTMAEGNKVFVAEGNWNEDANWRPQGAPALTDDVIIRANATIPADCVALADEITVEGTNTITIEDGGQLLHSTVAVVATMKKVVEPYEEAEGIDNYILLASPMQPTVFATEVNNLLFPATQDGYNVDFYKFDNSQEEEWVNLENIDEFQLANGEGYLYAHNWEEPITLSFTDALMYSHEPKAIPLTYNTNSVNWAGWNLIGNPFPCNATVSNAADPLATFNYYKINAAGEFVTADGTVAPMEGIFALATEAGQEATFTRVEPSENSIAPTDGILNVNLMSNEAATRKGNSRIDMARLRFGHGNNLGKLNLFRSNAIVFFPQDGKDYSVMYADAQGEMPLHFKTEKNGTYTLGFSTEDVSFGYLHLIDNLTGNDVDLLATPSYTFDARTTDYASRFRLVFSANGTNSDDNFGFIDAAGNLVITDATAGATLQIIDVMGRVVRTTDAVRHVSTNGMAPGVYMLRLINGTNVKVQKIVVK